MIFIYLQSLLNQIVVRINTARNSFVKYCIATSSAHSFSVFYLSLKKRSQAVTSTFILVGLSPPQCGMTRQYSNYQYLFKDLATHRYPHITPPRTRRTVFLSTRWTWSFKFFLSCCYARVRLQISLQNIITPHPWMETTSRSTGLTMLHRTWCTLHSRWKRWVG